MNKLVVLMFARLITVACLASVSTIVFAIDHLTPLDRVVVIVNGSVITQNEVNQRVRMVQQQLRAQGVRMPAQDVLQTQVLERLILEQAQLQAAQNNGIQVEDVLVDRAVARLAQQNNLSLQDFRNRIELDGISFSQFRQQIREDIIFNRLREREIDSKVQITDGEIDNFLASQKESQPAELNLGQILLRLPEGATSEQIRNKQKLAEKIIDQLQGGAEFSQLAAAYSDSPDGMTSGGSMGWRSAERLPQIFVDAVANLTPGQIASLLRSPAGFHIVKLIDRRTPESELTGPDVLQTHVRHILIRVNELMSDGEAQRRLRNIRERLENGASFTELARLYSSDGSANKGGDLGWVYQGDTVPEFEVAMNELKINELSEPIKTPFGWHLIQVLERRTEKISLERQRLTARQYLRERKSDEQYQDWLRQLRDRTYVEYRHEER